jgi:hypothetical protein
MLDNPHSVQTHDKLAKVTVSRIPICAKQFCAVEILRNQLEMTDSIVSQAIMKLVHTALVVHRVLIDVLQHFHGVASPAWMQTKMGDSQSQLLESQITECNDSSEIREDVQSGVGQHIARKLARFST